MLAETYKKNRFFKGRVTDAEELRRKIKNMKKTEQ